MKALLAGAAYFVFVFFKAFQQRNVAFLHHRRVFPAPISIVTGGGAGALLAMYLHHRHVENGR